MRGFFRGFFEILLHLGILLAAVTLAMALAAAGVPEIAALISGVILGGAVIGLMNSRQQRQEEARIARMPADEAETYKARALRNGWILTAVALVGYAVIAVWAQTPQAFALLAFYLSCAVWVFWTLRRRQDR